MNGQNSEAETARGRALRKAGAASNGGHLQAQQPHDGVAEGDDDDRGADRGGNAVLVEIGRVEVAARARGQRGR